MESQEYVNNPDNIGIYDVNTIANYDCSIIPYLNSRYPRQALDEKPARQRNQQADVQLQYLQLADGHQWQQVHPVTPLYGR